MTQQEELAALRSLVKEQKKELGKKDRIEQQDKRIRQLDIQVENMIQALLYARRKMFGPSTEAKGQTEKRFHKIFQGIVPAMSNVYVHFSQFSFPARYSVVNLRLESHSLRFREVIGYLYFLKEPFVMECGAEDKIRYLKVRFHTPVRENGMMVGTSTIDLDDKAPNPDFEMELCRFRLQAGARLRDTSFAMDILVNGGRIPEEAVRAYIEMRTGGNPGTGNSGLYYGLAEILRTSGVDISARKTSGGTRQQVMLL